MPDRRLIALILLLPAPIPHNTRRFGSSVHTLSSHVEHISSQGGVHHKHDVAD